LAYNIGVSTTTEGIQERFAESANSIGVPTTTERIVECLLESANGIGVPTIATTATEGAPEGLHKSVNKIKFSRRDCTNGNEWPTAKVHTVRESSNRERGITATVICINYPYDPCGVYLLSSVCVLLFVA